MQISISDEIFRAEAPYRILNAIHTAVDQHHELLIDLEGPSYKAWLSHCEASLDPDVTVLLTYAFGSSIFVGSKRSVEVVIAPKKISEVTFGELTTVLLRSFYIYVENGRADKRFIYAVLSPDLRRDIKRQVEIGAIHFENAGGISELSKKIEDDFRTRAKLANRAFALFDSDALVPGSASTDAIAAMKVCDDRAIPYYCLAKRAIENYIPDEALSSFAASGNTEDQRIQRKRIARAVSRLSDEQRSHFHMKEGFKAPHGDLYGTVTSADRSTLASGFGSHLSDCYEENGIVNRKQLENSSAWPELETLIVELMESI